MHITFVVAMDEAGLIGAGKKLPWRLPADLRHFKRTTLGHPILMGRRTFESIGRPLPDRLNLVLTRDLEFDAPGCRIVHSLDAAVAAAGDADELMVIGGAQVYAQCLPQAGGIVLTRVHARFEGDTWFPDPDLDGWREVSREDHAADERNPYPYTFSVLER